MRWAVIIASILVSQIRARESDTTQDMQPLRTFSAVKGPGGRIALSADGESLATGAFVRNWRLWDTNTWTNSAEGAGCFRALSPDGKTVLAVNSDGFVVLSDTSTGQARRTQITGSWVHEKTNAISSAAFSPDGKIIATACFGEGRVRLWDAMTLRRLAGNDRVGGPTALAFSGNSEFIAIGNVAGETRLCDAKSMREVHNFSRHERGVYALAFSPDSTVLATVSLDGTSKIWDVGARHEVRTLKLQGEDTVEAYSVAFSPDGEMLAVGYAEAFMALADGRKIESDFGAGIVGFWNTATGQEIRSLKWHRYAVSGVGFIHNGREFISADKDGNIAVWDASKLNQVKTLP